MEITNSICTFDIKNEVTWETSSSSEEEGEIPCKRFKLSKKNREKETDLSQEFMFTTSSSMSYESLDNDWDVDVYEVSTTALDKDGYPNSPKCKETMTTTKIGKLEQIKEIKRKLKRNTLIKSQVDYVKVKEDYLTITKRTNISSDMNLDDYHRWMKRDESPIHASKTLEVLKANRQGEVKLVSNATVVLGKILEELKYKQSILDIRHDSKLCMVSLSILSKPKWAFFGSGKKRNDAIEDASQHAIQFLLIMSV